MPVAHPAPPRLKRARQQDGGFTLIELLVVFSILALLLTLATPRYFKALEAGKEKVQAQNLATLRDAIDKFRADQGRYPQPLEEIVVKQYLRQIPLDPVSGTQAWRPVPSPRSEETGVYDVLPPATEPVTTVAETPTEAPAALPGTTAPQAPLQ